MIIIKINFKNNIHPKTSIKSHEFTGKFTNFPKTSDNPYDLFLNLTKLLIPHHGGNLVNKKLSVKNGIISGDNYADEQFKTKLINCSNLWGSINVVLYDSFGDNYGYSFGENKKHTQLLLLNNVVGMALGLKYDLFLSW